MCALSFSSFCSALLRRERYPIVFSFPARGYEVIRIDTRFLFFSPVVYRACTHPGAEEKEEEKCRKYCSPGVFDEKGRYTAAASPF